MAKAKKKAAKKKTTRAPWGSKKQSLLNAGDLLTIEDSPPPPLRTNSQQVLDLLDKVKRTIPLVKVGQAFLIPAKNRIVVKRYLADYYPLERYQTYKVTGNDTLVRVYKLEYRKPK